MVDIQSVTAEIRREKEEEITGRYNVHICYEGRSQKLQKR